MSDFRFGFAGFVCRTALLGVCLVLASVAFAQDDPGGPVPAPDPAPLEVFGVWPAQPLGNSGDIGPEIMLVERRRPFYQITNVSTPTVSVYLPAPEKATGAAVLVLPGGGLVRLAIEHEGYEVARWLTDHGIAAFLLKYRVPPRVENRREGWKTGVQDAQRAMGLIRSRATEWGIDPDGIGAIGFSAGGEIGTRLALNDGEREYVPIDAADRLSVRPRFMLNIYPGGLASGYGRPEPVVREDILSRIDEKTPPMFFVHAFPDDSMNSILMARALKMAKVPAELHLFQEGAHGFGVREGGSPLAAWPGLALAWMRSLGFLDPAHVRGYPGKFREVVEKGGKLPRISESKASTTLDEGYAAQRRLTGASSLKVAGYKGAMTSAAAQKQFGVDSPLHCVLFEPNVMKAAEGTALALAEIGPSMVETELGYIMGVDIATKIADPDEARTASQAVVPVIEIPGDLAKRMNGDPAAVDFVASNCGDGTRVIVGEQHHPDKVDLDGLAISLSRAGEVLHTTTGAATKGGQWANLMTLINHIVEQGRTIREGDLIISGSIGPAHAAEAGSYSAEFGELGRVEVEVR